MVRRSRTKRVDTHLAAKYHQVGQAFLAAADALSMVADTDETYGNAIALLAIHAAIAHADALTVAYGARKSADGDHERTVAVLRDVLQHRLPNPMESRLRGLVMAKDSVSYQGKYYPLDAGRDLLEKARAFAAWADRMYQERPTG